MGIYTKEEQLKLVKQNPFNLRKIDNQYEEVCLKAVKSYGWVLQYVKKQTPEICLEAIKKDATKLQYVKDQTEDICIEAVKRNANALQYVKEQTSRICLEAVKNYSESISKVKEKTPILCFYTFLHDYNKIHLKYIENGLKKFMKNQNVIQNDVFCYGLFSLEGPSYNYFDMDSLIYIKDFLLKQNNNNTYIFNDIDSNRYLELLKEIALSNNNLVIIDTGNIKDIHKMLANKIIKKEDLEKGAF